ncbi:sugar ABC transporter ATP-binding protein [Sneathiella sp.]|uniref:sugar ABC transporter ATP-binding protein n=1 Tax=Sneathiella sp. TaxID=1964365 RepID=UPI002604B8AE|nr:sugar ABC transporter ATP-binding protein [Sneathiella sp.]MDF2367970.1 sugar ABC transporter ATP-binding protein [Sneathiella sp.]
MSDTNQPLIKIEHGSKIYQSVYAIQDINFDLYPGEVHAILGENGAGKSTLTKALAGVVSLTEGRLLLEGKECNFKNPREALEAGIAMVFQETSLVPTMTVAQNLYLGEEKFFNRLRELYISAQQFLQGLNFGVDPTVNVAMLGAAQKQMVEIARAVLHNAKVIIFDEPTATLTPEEKQHFFNLLKDLKRKGVGVIFISHALEEALDHADRITILRDGQHIATDAAQNFDRDKVVQAMVGRELSDKLYSKHANTTRRARGQKILSVENLSMQSIVKNNSFSIYAGQITGIFGLIGSGRTETAKIISGVVKRDFFHGGEVYLEGKPIRYNVPKQGMRDGIAYVTEDRKIEGFFETMSIGDNIYMGHLAVSGQEEAILSTKRHDNIAKKWIKTLNVKALNADARVVELSGGNQQKVVIGKSLCQNPKIIFFDEPTRGVDVGAIQEIHDHLNRLADQGLAVVVISSYLPEILNLSDRILVARQGKIIEEFSTEEATEKKIMYAAVH